MFQLNKNGLADSELQRIQGQFKAFLTESDLLPCFSMSFFRFDPSENLPEKDFLQEINGFGFYKAEDGYFITSGEEEKRKVRIRLSKNYTHADAYYQVPDCELARCDIADLLYHGYRYRAVSCGDMMIHAAAVVHRGECILFCGMHAAGKSTQANLWIKYLGATPLNFDQPCIIAHGETVLAHGSPWSGKEELFLNEYAPIRAIVFVEKAEENKAVKISNTEAFSRIYLNNYLFPLDETFEEKYYEVINKVVSKTDVYRLSCTISQEAVAELFEAIYNEPYKTERGINMTYKRKSCFEMKDIAGDKVVVARGSSAITFNGILALNDACIILWEALENYISIESLAQLLVDEYKIDTETAIRDTKICIDKMLENGLLETAE